METNFACNTPQKSRSHKKSSVDEDASPAYSLNSPASPTSNFVDPEDLSPNKISKSPLFFPSSPFQKPSRSKIHSPGSSELKVKAFRVLSEKNDGDDSPLFEDDSPNLSNSTCADSPQLSALLKGRTISRSRFACLKLEAVADFRRSEEQKGSDESLNTRSSGDNNEVSGGVSSSIVAENVPSDANNLNPVDANPVNNENNNVDDTQSDLQDNGFGESFEFLHQKTPIIKIFLFLISVSLLSGALLGVLEEQYSYRSLFLMVYLILFSILGEKIVRICRSESPSILNNDASFNVLDVSILIVITIIADLRIGGSFNSLYVGSTACSALLLIYGIFSHLPLKQKIFGILKRALLAGQCLLIFYKVEDNFNVSWKFVLVFGWAVIAWPLLKLLRTTARTLLAFNNPNSSLSSISKSSKIVASIGLVFLSLDLVVVMLILFGICEVLDYRDPRSYLFLNNYLTVCQYLNASLLFFSTIAGSDLFEFVLTAADYFSEPQVHHQPTFERKLISVEQKVFAKRISPTYYKVLSNEEVETLKGTETPKIAEQDESKVTRKDSQDEKKSEESEENTCYICCGKEANGLVSDCGHGGICFECLTDYVSQKDDCMECRKRIGTILKFEEKNVSEGLFVSSIVNQIVRTEV